MAAFTELWTEEGKKQTGIPWDAYPRPECEGIPSAISMAYGTLR